MARKTSAAAANLQALMNSGVVPGISARSENMAITPKNTSPAAPQSQQLERQSIQEKRVEDIPLDLLLDNPYQPRTSIVIDQELQEMAEGIKTYGLLGAYPARKHPEKDGYYQLGFGHRRREASRLAGKLTMPIIVENLDNAVMAGMAAVENIHRVDLTPLELGKLFLTMRREGYTQEEIAEAVKKDRGYVVNRLRVAEASTDIQAFIEERPTSLRSAAYLIKVKNPDDRAILIDHLKAGSLTTDDLAGDLDHLLNLLKESKHVEDNRQETAAQQPILLSSPTSPQGEDDVAASSNGLGDTNLLALESDYSGEEKRSELVQSDARVGAAKLRTIVRNLQAYASTLEGRKASGLSRKEQELLRQIEEALHFIYQEAGLSS